MLTLAAVGVLCMAWGYFVEPYWLATTELRITSPKITGGEPIRLVHISDLHCDSKMRLEEQLPQAIAELKPDLIVFTGDCVNTLDGLVNFKRCMKEIAAIAPTFVCGGNWDNYFGDADFFSGTGVINLNGSSRRIRLRGSNIYLAGVGVRGRDRIDDALAGASEDDFTIFLYHYPDLIYSLAERGVDLVCSGHTHGGQVRLPLYGAMVTLSRYGKRFEAGLYCVKDTYFYVNRVIGMEGSWAPRVRFNCRPEVTLIEISPDE